MAKVGEARGPTAKDAGENARGILLLILAAVFGNLPDRWTLAGGGIVIGSGLYLLYRERVRHHHPSVDLAA